MLIEAMRGRFKRKMRDALPEQVGRCRQWKPISGESV
jgi:hypothetical protein